MELPQRLDTEDSWKAIDDAAMEGWVKMEMQELDQRNINSSNHSACRILSLLCIQVLYLYKIAVRALHQLLIT